MESAPLYDIVRDVNKLSNNVMARQIFLTLATTRHPPPATPALAADVVQRWLKDKKVSMPGLVLENGSGLSRNERATANGLARLLASADASPVREEFASSLAVAAIDGTVQRRFQDGTVAGQALLKTGSLEGVRALAGYVDRRGRAGASSSSAIVNHPNAARGGAALDYLVQWVYQEAGVTIRATRWRGATCVPGTPSSSEDRGGAGAGAFDDLPGAGKPLDLDDDRLVPEDVRIAYRILRNAGFVPAS